MFGYGCIFNAVNISAVVIASNEQATIEACVKALVPCCNEVIVVVNDEADTTGTLAAEAGATVYVKPWQGYGATKNLANSLAKNDWILSIDADEVVDATMQQSIKNLDTEVQNQVFYLTRYLVWQGKVLRHGLAKEKKIRLFHRLHAQWNTALVHEELLFTSAPNICKIEGCLLHYAYASTEEAQKRLNKYAGLMAEQKYKLGATTTRWYAYIAAAFAWIKQVVFKFAWLDGVAGLQFAAAQTRYTFNKYQKLAQLPQKSVA